MKNTIRNAKESLRAGCARALGLDSGSPAGIRRLRLAWLAVSGIGRLAAAPARGRKARDGGGCCG